MTIPSSPDALGSLLWILWVALISIGVFYTTTGALHLLEDRYEQKERDRWKRR